MALDTAGDTSLLLESTDVPPVFEDNAAGGSPFLLTCDHYGRLIPQSLGISPGISGLPASPRRYRSSSARI
jgi:predicted N-formylglutamate amidohydrolase